MSASCSRRMYGREFKAGFLTSERTIGYSCGTVPAFHRLTLFNPSQ